MAEEAAQLRVHADHSRHLCPKKSSPFIKDSSRGWQIGCTCWTSLRDWIKAWLRVSRWACDCCRCTMASSKVLPAGSVLSCSPLPSPLFLLFSQSWRRALVALFITSDLAWVLSWRPHRQDIGGVSGRGRVGGGSEKEKSNHENKVRDSGFQIMSD